jgi:hypothetical protein
MLLLLSLLLLLLESAAKLHQHSVPALHYKLFHWCMHDKRCRAGYRVEPEQALTESTLQGFSLLLTLWLPDEHVDDEVRFIEHHFRATNASEETRLRWLILLRLASAENARMRCGVNQRLVVSPGDDGYCLCRDNRWCEDGTSWHSVFNVAGTAINAATILLSIYAALGIYNEIRKIYPSSTQRRQLPSPP